MATPTLYLFVGVPGAGKTTTAEIISEKTGAIHLWADAERHKLFANPNHSLEESEELYANLNNRTEQMLSNGESVVFDTNFNFYSDRQKLRDIASKYNAKTVLIWITTPLDIARKRAVGTHHYRNGYMNVMSEEQFDAIAAKLENPKDEEQPIQIDGSDVKKSDIIRILNI
ncbi:MAG: AAA family ATPase [Candidatus Saccharimonadales bacterium]